MKALIYDLNAHRRAGHLLDPPLRKRPSSWLSDALIVLAGIGMLTVLGWFLERVK